MAYELPRFKIFYGYCPQLDEEKMIIVCPQDQGTEVVDTLRAELGLLDNDDEYNVFIADQLGMPYVPTYDTIVNQQRGIVHVEPKTVTQVNISEVDNGSELPIERMEGLLLVGDSGDPSKKERRILKPKGVRQRKVSNKSKTTTSSKETANVGQTTLSLDGITPTVTSADAAELQANLIASNKKGWYLQSPRLLVRKIEKNWGCKADEALPRTPIDLRPIKPEEKKFPNSKPAKLHDIDSPSPNYTYVEYDPDWEAKMRAEWAANKNPFAKYKEQKELQEKGLLPMQTTKPAPIMLPSQEWKFKVAADYPEPVLNSLATLSEMTRGQLDEMQKLLVDAVRMRQERKGARKTTELQSKDIKPLIDGLAEISKLKEQARSLEEDTTMGEEILELPFS